MRRLQAVVIVSMLAQGCAHGVVNGSADSMDHTQECGLYEVCGGGTGVADGVVSAAVAGTIVGAVLVMVYRRLVHGASR